VAIKKIFDPRLTDDLLFEIYNEIVMQSIIRHPNVALLMGVMPTIPNIVIVFEFVSGSLFNLLHMKKTTTLSLEQRMKIAKDVAMVFHYIHSLGIVHRDIKSHNILIDDNMNVKICDFGLARFKADLNKGSMQFSGTPAYMAPELFQKRAYDETVDIFAYGTLLWELLCREVPYDGLDPSDIRAKVEKEEPMRMPYGVDPRIAQLIMDCRQVDFSRRPGFDRVLETLNFIIR
jgi:serine/threonine protein kinase